MKKIFLTFCLTAGIVNLQASNRSTVFPTEMTPYGRRLIPQVTTEAEFNTVLQQLKTFLNLPENKSLKFNQFSDPKSLNPISEQIRMGLNALASYIIQNPTSKNIDSFSKFLNSQKYRFQQGYSQLDDIYNAIASRIQILKTKNDAENAEWNNSSSDSLASDLAKGSFVRDATPTNNVLQELMDAASKINFNTVDIYSPEFQTLITALENAKNEQLTSPFTQSELATFNEIDKKADVAINKELNSDESMKDTTNIDDLVARAEALLNTPNLFSKNMPSKDDFNRFAEKYTDFHNNIVATQPLAKQTREYKGWRKSTYGGYESDADFAKRNAAREAFYKNDLKENLNRYSTYSAKELREEEATLDAIKAYNAELEKQRQSKSEGWDIVPDGR